MTYSTLAVPANIGLVIEGSDPVTTINIAENGEAGRIIGELVFEGFVADHSYSFSFVDPESGDAVEIPFEVVAGTGDDAGKFFFKLLDDATLDFEGEALPAFAIKVTDEDEVDGGTSAPQVITVTIDNVAEAPTAIVVGNGTTLAITENEDPIDLGAISHQDGIAGEYTYTLVSAGGENNPNQLALEDVFAIVDGHLVQLAPLDREAYPDGTFTFKIRAEIDGVAGTAFEQAITVAVANVNEAPTAIDFGTDGDVSAIVGTNASDDDVIATLRTIDQDVGDTHSYRIVGADGHEVVDGPFTIDGSNLVVRDAQALAELFGTQPIQTIRIESKDADGEVFYQDVTITIEEPSEITNIGIKIGEDDASDAIEIAENGGAGRIIGELVFDGFVAGHSYSFAFVDGDGEEVEVPFEVVAGTGDNAGKFFFKLLNGATLDFEGDALPAFAVEITDTTVFSSATKPITVTVANVVEAPTAIAVDGQTALTITENEDPAESLGTIGHMGGDEGEYTYTLMAVDGDGNPNQTALEGLFEIDENGHLVQLAPLDREAYPDGTITFKIRAEIDGVAGTAFEQAITVAVANVNEAPTAIDFGTTGNVTASVDNDASLHDVIATLRTIDQDVGDTHTYMIVTGDGEDDTVVNSAFTIEDGKLVVGDATLLPFLDGIQQIWIKSTDAGGESVWQQVSVNVQEPVNHAPTAVKVKIGQATPATAITVAELGAAGREIGVLSADDQDQGQTHTYLIEDQNSPFEIVDGVNGTKVLKLKADVVLDREAYANGTFTLHIKVTDNGNPEASFTQAITVNVGNENEAPTDITLSKANVAENSAAGTEVGALAAMDQDWGDSFTFSLTDNAGGAFKIENGKVVVADASKLDYETATSHKIKVKVTDAGGFTFEKELMIGVTDVAESIGGAKKNDKLVGGIGTDILDGKAGKDTLTGGLGKDAFVFSTKLGKSNVDKITDFKVGEDMIYLDNAVFKKLGKAGSLAGPAKLKKANFVLGSKAKDKNDYVGYDSKKGVLWYDSNGSAAGGQETIATLSKKLKMTFDHFFIV